MKSKIVHARPLFAEFIDPGYTFVVTLLHLEYMSHRMGRPDI